MTRLELINRLKNEGIPRERYSLEGGQHEGRLCLERRNNRWFVYYNENGGRTQEKNFILEEVAYLHFYNEIVKTIQ